MTNDLTADQHNAMKHIPECVELEDLDKVSTWQHVIYRVEHVVDVYEEGNDFYTRPEAVACRNWLAEYAPNSEYAAKD